MGRIYRRLVLEKQIAVETDGGADIIETNGPTQMVTRIFHKPEFTSEENHRRIRRNQSPKCRSRESAKTSWRP